MAIIKNEKTKSGADVYDSLNGASMVFHGFAGFAVRGHDVVLCGAHGKMRDHIIPLEKCVDKYYDVCRMYDGLIRAGTRGWDELGDILHDFRAKIMEACDLRIHDNVPVPQKVRDFVERGRTSSAPTAQAQVVADLAWLAEQERLAAFNASLKK
jgi:hypothetical protein